MMPKQYSSFFQLRSKTPLVFCHLPRTLHWHEPKSSSLNKTHLCCLHTVTRLANHVLAVTIKLPRILSTYLPQSYPRPKCWIHFLSLHRPFSHLSLNHSPPTLAYRPSHCTFMKCYSQPLATPSSKPTSRPRSPASSSHRPTPSSTAARA